MRVPPKDLQSFEPIHTFSKEDLIWIRTLSKRGAECRLRDIASQNCKRLFMSNLSNIWAASTPSIIVFLVYIIYYAYFLQRLRRHIVGTYCFCINSIDLKTLIEPEMSFVLIKSLVVIIKGSFHSPAFSQIYRSIDQLHEHKNI